MEHMMTELATSKRTHKNIEKTLEFSLKEKYGVDSKKISNEILKIHGLSDEDFDAIGVFSKFFIKPINDVSIDSNSNKNEKTVMGILNESVSSIYKSIGYDFLYRTMCDSYGKKEAKRLSGEMYDYSLAISDSTKILVPYCWAFDASKISEFGRPFGQLKSSQPKRIGSYIAALVETIHQLSNHLAGAVAVGTFFLDIAKILIYRQKITLDVIKEPIFRKNIENEFQQFVHSVNSLSRIGSESPFTNLSIFDKIKLQNFLTQDNYAWYFEGLYDDDNNLNAEYRDYVVDFIMELQKIFLNFFDEGDPTKNGIPYRFPVITLNISKKQNDKIEDEEFLSLVTKLDISRYNIFVSEGNKVSSCCRLLSDMDMINLAGQVNSFGGGSSVSLGSHRVVTVNFNRVALESTSIDSFYSILESRIEDAAKILLAHKKLIMNSVDKNMQPFIKIGWIDMKKMFSTFGILGGYEAVKTLEHKFNIDQTNDTFKDILEFFNLKITEYSKKCGILGNVEQIPAESMASRLVEVDKLLFGSENVPYELYSNQFVPLWESASIWERMEMDGKYTKLLTGGGIAHITIGEKVTSAQAKSIIKFAVKSGCEHFALNAVYSECKNNHVMIGKLKVCPYCSAEIVEYYTRVVGFFTPVSSWSKTRRDWEFDKRVIVSNGDLDKPKEIK